MTSTGGDPGFPDPPRLSLDELLVPLVDRAADVQAARGRRSGGGLGTPARSSGLASMRRRAENNGGTLTLSVPAGGGTRLTWTARPGAAG